MLSFTQASIHGVSGNNTMKTITLVICCSLVASHAGYATGEQQISKRIEIYALSQNHWDIQPGDTLGSIVQHLLPNNPTKHAALKKDIVHLNPQAFINANPELLLAGKRLHLPGYMKPADSIANPTKTQVERFSWGNIKRARN